MPSSANRPAANSETPSKTMVALTIFNGLVLQHCPEHNTMHTARVVARESGEGCAPQSGDCHQFPPLELAGCTRFAPRETHAAVRVHSTCPATMEQGPIYAPNTQAPAAGLDDVASAPRPARRAQGILGEQRPRRMERRGEADSARAVPMGAGGNCAVRGRTKRCGARGW